MGAGRSGASAGFSIVVAMDRNRGIGRDGGLPWKLSGDMRFFKELTTCPDSGAVEKRWGLKAEESSEAKGWEEVRDMLRFAHPLPQASARKLNAVLMGRVTYESLPEAYRPLPDRRNIALSRYPHEWPQVVVKRDLDALLKNQEAGKLFIIGGGQIFKSAIQHPACAHLYITEIDSAFECDTFFPETPGFAPVLSSPWIVERGIRYRFRRYDRG